MLAVGAVALLIDVAGIDPLLGAAALLAGCLAILAAVTAVTTRRH